MRLFSVIALGLSSSLGAGFFAVPALSAGFAIKNQSSLAQGNAFAGATAGAEGISYMVFNPAGLTRQDGHRTEVGSAYIIPKARFEGGSASTVLSTPISGEEAARNFGDEARGAVQSMS